MLVFGPNLGNTFSRAPSAMVGPATPVVLLSYIVDVVVEWTDCTSELRRRSWSHFGIPPGSLRTDSERTPSE